MRINWIKAAGVLLAVVILFLYQTQARSLSEARTALEEKEKALAEAEAAGRYKDGVYTGTGTGYGGDLTVSVTVQDGRITEARVTETQDDEAYLALAEQVLEDIVAKQGTDGVDTVSGATMSSRGILEAVDNALVGGAN